MLQPIFAVVGGIILVLVNAVGDPGVYVQLVNLLQSHGYISESSAETIKNVFYFIAYLGGISVIIGGLLYLKNLVRLATFFISVGAGISATMLALRAISLGPALREALEEGGLTEFLSLLLGVNLGLRLIGTLLALMALLTYYMPLLFAGIASIGYFASGATIIVHAGYLPSLSLMGVVILVIGVIGSLGHVNLARFLAMIALLLYVPSFVLRLFGGFFDRRTFAFSLLAMAFTLLLIVWSPKVTERVVKKVKKRQSF